MNEILTQFGWWSFVDIFLVSIAIYYFFLIVKRTHAAQMLTGIIITICVFILSSTFPLTTVNWIITKIYSSIILILIILFQDDLRIALRRLGKKPFFQTIKPISSDPFIEEITKTAYILAQNKTGALIVLERKIILNRYVDIGIKIDASISKEILLSIFQTKSPLHDGAVIIQEGRLVAAGCFLPLSRDESLDPNLGTRHRAAIGITQETDAIVIIVSEENGHVSFVIDGCIFMALPPKELKKMLRKHYLYEENGEEQTIKNSIS